MKTRNTVRLILPFLITLTVVMILVSLKSVCLSQTKQEASITIQADLRELLKKGKEIKEVGIRGNIEPLSWDKSFPLTDTNSDGIYEATLSIKDPKNLEYKFVLGSGDTLEWETNNNRKLNGYTAESNFTALSIWDSTFDVPKSELSAYKIPVEGLQEDVKIMRKALTDLHPGLYKYIDSVSLEQEFDKLAEQFQTAQTIPEAYKAIGLVLAKIKCGHTMAGAYNQGAGVTETVFNQRNQLPFSTKIISGELYIDKQVSEDDRLIRGTRIERINGEPVSNILSTLLTITNADGSNDAMRHKKLEILGYGERTFFDIFFPLFYPLNKQAISLEVEIPNGEVFTTTVDATTFEVREKKMFTAFPDLPNSYDDLWSFELLNDEVALLKLGTFVTWKMEMSWKAFLNDVFSQLNEKDVKYLIVDIRGNGGGMDAPSIKLVRNIIKEPLEIKANQNYTSYQKVDEEIRPYLATWNNKAFDISNQVIPYSGRLYVNKNKDKARKLTPTKNSFKGKTYVVVDASNSSATYILAKNLKKNNVATLVGQTTGGNLKGINGGQMFFLTLPNSTVELDIPLWGENPPEGTPDRGVEPDIYVPQNPNDLINGVDTEIAAILDHITNSKTTQQ